MKKKRVLINAYIPGSMHCLRDYYQKKLQPELGGRVKFMFNDHYKIGRLKHYAMRIRELLGRYDVIIGDYPSRIYVRAKDSIYMAHGYGTKNSPGKDEVTETQKLEPYQQMRNSVKHLVTLGYPDYSYYWRYDAPPNTPFPNVYPLGLPRNDVLYDASYVKGCRRDIDEQYNTGGKFILLYAPTWRGYQVEVPYGQDDFARLDKQLGELNACMFYRPHYMEDLFSHVDFSSFENIYDGAFSKQSQTATLQSAADMVLTDYSTIFIDYLVLQRPVAFSLFDWEQYDGYRGIVYEKDDFTSMPGPRIDRLDDVATYIEAVQQGHDEYIGWRQKSYEHYVAYRDGDSSGRVWALVTDILGLERPSTLSCLAGADAKQTEEQA